MPQPYSVPLIIGITGHRDLRPHDVPALETEVAGIVRSLRDRCPNTPLVIYSALAEGADQLAARVALAEGAQLVAVLPMPQPMYEQDFQDAGSLDAFRSLLAQAVRVEVARPDAEVAAMAGGPSGRDLLYVHVGAWIVQHSQVLIALWDGTTNGKPGGTAEVVRYRLEGCPVGFGPPRSLLDAPRIGTVLHIRTPRQSNPASHSLIIGTEVLPRPKGGEPAGQAWVKHTASLAWKTATAKTAMPIRILDAVLGLWQTRQKALPAHEQILADIDHFNAELARPELEQIASRSRQWLLGDDPPAWVRDPAYGEIIARFCRADAAAINLQNRARAMLWRVFGAAAVAIVLFNLTLALPQVGWIGYAYQGLLLLVYTLIMLAKRKRLLEAFLDARAVAEAFRVQLFWSMAGLNITAADHYLRRQRGSLGWFREALRGGAPSHKAVVQAYPTDPAERMVRLAWVVEHWLEDQRRYYCKAAHRDTATADALQRRAHLFFATGFIIMSVQSWGWVKGWLPAGSTVYVGLAGNLAQMGSVLLLTWADKQALRDQARQYDRMAMTLNAAVPQVRTCLQTEDHASVQDTLVEVGCEFLAEHGDWLQLRRNRPIEAPTK
jgi:hypothetical protein